MRQFKYRGGSLRFPAGGNVVRRLSLPDQQGNGYATEATALCLEHAFADRGLQIVFARVFEHNDPSMCVLEALGFQQEGCLREHDYLRGAYRDTYLFGLLADEWAQVRESQPVGQ